jgi:hypothetical protein
MAQSLKPDMTEAEQVKKMVALLSEPPTHDYPNGLREELARDALAQVNLAEAEVTKSVRERSATTKKALEDLEASLGQASYRVNDLPEHMRPPFQAVAEMRKTAANLLKVFPPTQAEMNGERRRGYRIAPRQKAAVGMAEFLLVICGAPLKKTRDGKWHRLAAILYGNEKIDLFSHIQKTETSPNLS